MEVLPISVCMIVRDEAEVLSVALDAVRDWAKEVIVVDTGSTDDSIDVARRAGALVRSITWQDDFSAARNVSIDLATSPWVLILDADEWIDPESVADLARLIDVDPPIAYRLPQRNYVDRVDWAGFQVGSIPPVWGLEAVGWVTARQMRLVPNGRGIFYEGAVHETMVPSIEAAAIATGDADLPIHHVGKLRTAAIMARKKQLYKRLGEAKFESDPSGMAAMELGIQCSEFGDHEPACRLLRIAIDRLASGPERARAVGCLASQVEAMEGSEAAIALLRGELAREAVYPDLWERLGILLMRAGQFARAAEVLERAIVSFPDATNLLRLAAESELAVRQYGRAEELYTRLEDASESTGMGRSGRAVSRAGDGDPDLLLECLESSRPAMVSSALIGAQRWLDPRWVFGTRPGAWSRVDRAAAIRLLRAAWGARRREAALHVVEPSPSTAVRCGIEALEATIRAAEVPDHVAIQVASRLGTDRWATVSRTVPAVPAGS